MGPHGDTQALTQARTPPEGFGAQVGPMESMRSCHLGVRAEPSDEWPILHRGSSLIPTRRRHLAIMEVIDRLSTPVPMCAPFE
ncbi:hypothetical protein NL676_035040 [Syzygium grande]|nr:hypothetical protein NL676_035040 [Syzygium grande]